MILSKTSKSLVQNVSFKNSCSSLVLFLRIYLKSLRFIGLVNLCNRRKSFVKSTSPHLFPHFLQRKKCERCQI